MTVSSGVILEVEQLELALLVGHLGAAFVVDRFLRVLLVDHLGIALVVKSISVFLDPIQLVRLLD